MFSSRLNPVQECSTKARPADVEADKKVTIRTVSHDEEGKKRVDKAEFVTRNTDTIKYVDRKLMDKGLIRKERHPTDGIGIGRPPPKSGHGGKYTWEGPNDMTESELDTVPPAIDEKDPNYVDEEAEARILRGEVSDLKDYVVGEVEVHKVK